MQVPAMNAPMYVNVLDALPTYCSLSLNAFQLNKSQPSQASSPSNHIKPSNLQILNRLCDVFVKAEQDNVVDRSTHENDGQSTVHRRLGNRSGRLANLFGLSKENTLRTSLASIKRVSLHHQSVQSPWISMDTHAEPGNSATDGSRNHRTSSK